MGCYRHDSVQPAGFPSHRQLVSNSIGVLYASVCFLEINIKLMISKSKHLHHADIRYLKAAGRYIGLLLEQ